MFNQFTRDIVSNCRPRSNRCASPWWMFWIPDALNSSTSCRGKSIAPSAGEVLDQLTVQPPGRVKGRTPTMLSIATDVEVIWTSRATKHLVHARH